MKKIIITIIFATLYLTVLQAQNTEKTVSEIRKEYNKLKSQISNLEKMGKTGELYCMHISDNVYGKSYPNSGKFQAEYRYYYILKEGEPPLLRMVIENIKDGDKTVYGETMFDTEGKIIFIYDKNGYDNNIEKRIYRDNEEFIKYTENNVEKNIANELPDVIIWMHRSSKAHKERFDIIMYAD